MGKHGLMIDRESLEPAGMRLMGRLFAHASFEQCRYLGAWLGLGLYAVIGKRRQAAVANVRLAFPHLSHAAAEQYARRAAMNFGMTFAEFMHLPNATKQEVRDYCECIGTEHIDAALAAGKGALLMSGHMGSWEVMAARMTQEFPISVIVRPNSNPGVQAVIDAERAAIGMKTISKNDHGKLALTALRQNRALAILNDQHAGPGGTLLPVFGQPTRMVTSVGRLAMISGAPILPIYGIRRRPWLRDGRVVVKIEPAFCVPNPGKDPAAREEAIRAATLRGIAELEKVITHFPDQWLWLHRRWRDADGAVFPA